MTLPALVQRSHPQTGLPQTGQSGRFHPAVAPAFGRNRRVKCYAVPAFTVIDRIYNETLHRRPRYRDKYLRADTDWAARVRRRVCCERRCNTAARKLLLGAAPRVAPTRWGA